MTSADEGNDGVTEDTAAEDEREGLAAHQADRAPSGDEEAAAERAAKAEGDEEQQRVAAHYEDMAERGAKQPGEGRIP